MNYQLLQGDCIEVMRTLPANSCQVCVTSPPYYGLRDYGVDGQIGLEETPEAYVAKLVDVFREVRRLLHPTGTLWLNLGDSYASTPAGNTDATWTAKQASNAGSEARRTRSTITPGIKPKDLIGIPWSVAKALQAPYYTGRIAAERDRVWLAATIDAEGTICGFTHIRKDNGETRRGVHITITNSNMRMLDEAYRIWKTSKQDHNAHGIGHLGHLDTYRWIAHGVEEKQQLLAELYPYLICKKVQALLAWNFLEISKQARGRNKGKEGDENRDKSAWIVDALSKLNHMESVDIPSWCKEPPSLYEQGYYLRSEIIWAKKSPMPESVTDRPTKAHEQVFLLAKQASYYYDADAIREPHVSTPERYDRERSRFADHGKYLAVTQGGKETVFSNPLNPLGANRRSVWSLGPESFAGAHFATMPTKLVEPCILAGTSAHGCCAKCGAPWERVVEEERTNYISRADRQTATGGAISGGVGKNFPDTTRTTTGWQPTCQCQADVVPCTVLDPFAGSGTTLAVALKHHRNGIGIELNSSYLALAHERIQRSQPTLFELTT